MKTASTSVLALLLFAGSSGAQVVKAGRVLDVRTGTYLKDAEIRIEGGRIAEILPARGAESSAGAIDLSDLTILPGLIDSHVHLCGRTWDDEFDWWTEPIPSFGIVAVGNAKVTLEAGFTTVRHVGDHFYCGVAVRDAIAKGWMEGPRVLTSGPYVTMTGGHGAAGNWMAPQHQGLRQWASVADGPDAVRRAIREQLNHGVDLIKICATGGFHTASSIPGAASYTVEELRAAVEEAAKQGKPVAAHAHGAEGILNAVAAGVRSVEHGFLIDDEAMLAMRDRGVYLVADPLAAHYDLVEADLDWSDKGLTSSNAEEYRKYAARVARAHELGLLVAFGTDASVYPHGRNAEQFALLAEAGIEPLDAIRSATIVAAEMLGIADTTGSIEVGKWADLIAVRGDPLADVSILETVAFVMKAGVVHKPVSRDDRSALRR